MENHIVIIACFAFIGMVILLFVITFATYHIGYNNGYATGYKDSRRDIRRKRINANYSQSFDNIRILPLKSKKPVYIDSRSKYEAVDYDKTY